MPINTKIIQILDHINDLEFTQSSEKFNGNNLNIQLFRGNLLHFAEMDPILSSLLNGFNRILGIYLQSFVYDAKPQVCQTCGSSKLTNYGTYRRNFKDLIGKYETKVQRYFCGNCGGTTSIDEVNKDKAAFENCTISKEVSRLIAVLYEGGCSLRYVADIIRATKTIEINKDTVRNHLLKIGYEIRESWENELDRKKANQVAMDEQYFTIRTRDPNDQSMMVIAVIDLERDKIIRLRTEKAETVTYLDTKFIIDEFEKTPEVFLTDGNKSLQAGLKDFAPNSHHEKCLQHRSRNINRKDDVVKTFIDEKSDEIIDQEINKIRNDLMDTYKSKVRDQLTELLKDENIDKKTAWKELSLADKDIEEIIELYGYDKEGREIRKEVHESFLYRRLYSGRKVAEMIRVANLDLSSKLDDFTTAVVEGYHRTMRAREKKLLCFRTFEFAEVVSIINAELYNYKRGHGSIKSPFDGFKLLERNHRDEAPSRPITIRGEKYKRQRSSQIYHPSCDHTIEQVVESIVPTN